MEFCGHATLTWAHDYGVTLQLIEPGKSSQQSAYIESFNDASCECLNEHCFIKQTHGRAPIEPWRCEYNEKPLKKILGGPTSTAYAR